jgi:hypothetical protein
LIVRIRVAHREAIAILSQPAIGPLSSSRVAIVEDKLRPTLSILENDGDGCVVRMGELAAVGGER